MGKYKLQSVKVGKTSEGALNLASSSKNDPNHLKNSK